MSDAPNMTVLPHLRVGKRIIFPREAVLRWFNTAGDFDGPPRKGRRHG